MRFSVAAAAVLSAAVSAQAQTTWNVTVGNNGTLTYTPSSLNNVANGDIVSFQFVSKNHSVTQSSFLAPCTANGVSSGFQDAENLTGPDFPTWSITIENNTNPLWFFCAQTTANSTHCQSGMVFAINPTATKNFTAFQTLAMTPNASLPAGQNPPGTVVTTEAALSAGPLSSQTSETPSPSGTPSPSSGGNGTTGSNGTTSSNTTSGSPPANTNAAMKMSGSSISLLTVAGLVAGLAL